MKGGGRAARVSCRAVPPWVAALALMCVSSDLAPVRTGRNLERGPYLQLATPTSIVVRWRTETPTSSAVAWGKEEGELDARVEDQSPVTDHVVSVTGFLT